MVQLKTKQTNYVIASEAWQSPRVLIGENSYEIASSFLLAMTYEEGVSKEEG